MSSEHVTTPDRARQLVNPRDGGPFTAATGCPRCQRVDVHDIREPNQAAPRKLDWLETSVQSMSAMTVDGTFTFDHHRGFDRWDERAFEVVRACAGCGYEWGQT